MAAGDRKGSGAIWPIFRGVVAAGTPGAGDGDAGFPVLGTPPGGFVHPEHRPVGLHAMFRSL
jgi:hypothetical protein